MVSAIVQLASMHALNAWPSGALVHIHSVSVRLQPLAGTYSTRHLICSGFDYLIS